MSEPVGTLGQRVKSAIARSGKTQEKVEEEIGVGSGYLSKVIKDERSLGGDILIRFSAATGVRPEWIVTGIEIPDHALWGAVPRLPPPLKELDGFQEAAIQVGRREPAIDVAVFDRAGRTHFDPPPERVTEELLHGLILLLARATELPVVQREAEARAQKLGATAVAKSKAAARERGSRSKQS